jgi:chemotaxis protein methyltransferase CheR
MTMATKSSVHMADKEFDRLRKIVYERSGIWFADGKKYVIESRLGRRLEELEMTSFDQYASFLTMGPYQKDEFQEMFNRITINETSFFRNEPQLQIFEREVLPGLLEKRAKSKRIRVWSAACSTGEEPYTLAILMHRALGVRLTDWKIEILGTDISERALSVGQEGRYGDYALRSTSPLMLKSFFKPEGQYHRIIPEIGNMVNFEVNNLKDSFAMRRHGIWDLIFCRNVMIYFDDAMKTHCEKTFHQLLAEDGTLFIGHSETIIGQDRWLRRSEPESFAYTKKGL